MYNSICVCIIIYALLVYALLIYFRRYYAYGAAVGYE